MSAHLHTKRSVAGRLQVSERTVERLIRSGDLQTIRIGRLVRISEDTLSAFLAGRS